MTTTLRLVPVLTVAAVLACTGNLSAQQGEWSWAVRAVSVVPDDSCESIDSLGTTLTLSTAGGIAFEAGYGLTRTLAVDLALTGSRHTLHTTGGTDGGLEAGTVWLAPATLSLRYRLPLLGSWHPYAGVGLQYSQLFGYEISSEVQAHGLEDLEFDGSLGLAAQVGVWCDLSERWFASLEVAYLQAENEVTLFTPVEALYDTVELRVDPWQVGLGFGYRF